MSQPRNNLEALQRQLPSQQKSSYFAPPQSPKPTKFKPAKTGNSSSVTGAAQSGTPQLPSFTTPGYGKQKPRPPASTSLHTHSSNEAIDISSSIPTSPTSAYSIPSKRSSSDLAPVLPTSPKRPRIAPLGVEKENAFSALQKGKERVVQTPPPSHHHASYALGSLCEAASSTSVHPQSVKSSRSAAVAPRSFNYIYKVHADLSYKTAEELQVLYNINDSRFQEVRQNRDRLRMRRASNDDPYILEGLLDLLDDRLNAITNAIAACESDSEDMSALCQPAAGFALANGATTRTHSYDSNRVCEIPLHETQIVDDEDFDTCGTHISNTGHGSTLPSDIPNNVSGANIALDRGAQAVTNTSTPRSAFSPRDMEVNVPAPVTSDSRSSHNPAFAAADDVNNRRGVYHGPASDDELWKCVDGNAEDDSVDTVAPDAEPRPLFSAVAALRPPPAETPSEANLKASPHCPEIVEKLRNVFHLKAFRKNQLAAIVSTLEGRDVIVLMPTGGGKSLCYQLPAVCRGGKTSGVTVVISPLLSLITDQVERLHSLSIDVMMLVSKDSQDGNTMHQLRTTSKPSLVYVTPEKLGCNDNMKAILKGLYARQQLARFVIDEAHLINTWGRDFRAVGYGALVNIRKDFPDVPIVALTATATSEALQDIVTALGLSDYVLLSQSFNRPNLRYTVIPKKRDIETKIVQFIKEKYPNETGIIYCLARVKTEEVALSLRTQNIMAKHFHAGLAHADKKRIQQEWQNGECKIIVSTTAFGMGVDKADVRFVIHYDVPESVDAYCQETGRAGRDGKVADCILYYTYYDIQRRIVQINKDKDIDACQKDRRRQAVHALNQFCLNEVDCRRMLLLNHFAEKFDPAFCKGTCDNCASTDEVSEIDLTALATVFVKLIQELENRCMKITGPMSLNAFRGTSKTDMRKRSFDTLYHFGRGSEISPDLAKRLFDHLVARDILMTELEEVQAQNRAPISYVYLGPKAEEFLANKPSFVLTIRSGKRAVGAQRSKKALQYPIRAPMVSIRKKRTRTQTPDDTVESFSPIDDDPNFDDIEPESGPVSVPVLEPVPERQPEESTLPPLLQARKLRVEPSIQVIERPTGDILDSNQECFRELCTLRDQFATERDCDPEDILSSETLEILSLKLPGDMVAFKEILTMEQEAKEKWDDFGESSLYITSKYAIHARAESALVILSPAEMHERFDYRVASSSSKSLGGR